MHPNAELIQRFYSALSRLDGAAMAACYTAEASFSDPVFQGLNNGEPGKMWRMLTTRGKDMTVVFDGIDSLASRSAAPLMECTTRIAPSRDF